jgi:hypothetical protein
MKRSCARGWRRVLIYLAALGLAAAGWVGLAVPEAHATVYHSHDTSLVSNYSHLFASAEEGWSGSGQFSKGVTRARAGAPGPWEHFALDYVHDWNSGAPANEVLIYSYAAHNYVSAEFGWPGSNRGILHVRPGSAAVGLWETFYVTNNSDGTISFSVYDFSGTRYYVSAEEGWTGNGYGTLRARARSIGPWEKFAATPRFIDGHNDYPWASTTPDTWIGGWQYTRECDSFVAWKIYENDGGRARPASTGKTPGDYKTYSVDINDPPGGIGPNAGNWAANAARWFGFPVNRTPTVGSAAQWDYNGDGGRFKVGHVALVTAVFPDGSIDIAQYNLLEDHQYSTLHLPRAGTTFAGLPVSWPDNFVHVKGF